MIRFLKYLLYGVIWSVFGVCIIVIGFFVINMKGLYAIADVELSQSPNSEVYASDNKTLLWTNAEYQHKELTSENTPVVVKHLLIATEDKSFYQNPGFSTKGTLNAVKSKVLDGNAARGGSTITQQLIKNIRYADGKTDVYNRKAQEIILAYRLTKETSKDKIMMAYLNKVGFLENSYGFNTAMYLLYGEEITKDHTSASYVAKYATIVGMLKNPTIYNPRSNPDLATKRRNQVLYNAYSDGYLSKSEYKQAKAVKISEGLRSQGWLTQQVYETAAEHGSYVNSALKQLSEKGYDLSSRSNPLRVITNLNISENSWLQERVKDSNYYVNERQELAVTVTDPKTGVVRAQVGSRNGGAATDLNRAEQTVRSSGSVVKPFLDYAPLIEFSDVTENSIWNGNSTIYPGTSVVVRNYGGYTYGNVSTQTALKLSLNVPAVLALQKQEGWMSNQIMSNLNLYNYKYNDKNQLEPSGSFGGADALGINNSTKNFAAAFGALASNGVYKEPMYVKSVFSKGVESKVDQVTRQAVSPRTSYKLLKMMKTTMDTGGSAESAKIPGFRGYSTKTGTVGYDDNVMIYSDKSHKEAVGNVGSLGTLLATDSWMAGTTKSASVAVWTGFDDINVYGDWIDKDSSTRAEIYRDIMEHFNQGMDTSDWTPTDEVKDVKQKVFNGKSVELPIDADKLGNNVSVEKVHRSDVQLNKDIKDFYKAYQEGSLDGKYLGVKSYFENDDGLGYYIHKHRKEFGGFYKLENDQYVKIEP